MTSVKIKLTRNGTGPQQKIKLSGLDDNDEPHIRVKVHNLDDGADVKPNDGQLGTAAKADNWKIKITRE